MTEEIKGLIEAQGKAFEEFKTTLDGMKAEDAVTKGKLEKVEQSLDAAVEAKAQIEARLEAEKKEREELEVRLSKRGIQADSETEAKAALNLADFNNILAGVASERKRAFTPLDREGYDAFRAAQLKLFREGKENLEPEEVKALSVGSDPDGGYFVTPDMGGRIVRKVYETSPVRQIASVQTISTDALEGIEDLEEAGAGYAGETAQGSDTTTPQVGKWRIPVHWIDTEPKATQQLLDDAAVDIEGWLAGKIADKFARFENAEFVTGAAARIRGITGYTTAADSGSGVTWGQIGHVVSGASGAFASSNPSDKLYDLIGTVKQAYLMNARFLTRRSVITAIRKFKDADGRNLWQPSLVLGEPESLMGYPITRAEDMPALASGSLSLGFGDFTGYQVVDRVGIRVLRDPYTAKPYIKFYTTKRVGGGVVNFESFKLMKFST